MTPFLLRLYCAKLLVVHLERRWEKVESVVLAAKLVSGGRHWSDNVLISWPRPNGNHSWKQEVCSAGDSLPPPRGPSWARWALDGSSHTSGLHQSRLLCKKRDEVKELLVDDLRDFSSVGGQLYHVTDTFSTRHAVYHMCYRIPSHIKPVIAGATLFLLCLTKNHMDWKPNRKPHQHIWCFSFKYRQNNTRIESSTVAIILLLYAAAACVLSAKPALFLLWWRSVYSLSVKLWRKKALSYLPDWQASEFISAISKVSMKRCPLSVYTNMFDAPGYRCRCWIVKARMDGGWWNF